MSKPNLGNLKDPVRMILGTPVTNCSDMPCMLYNPVKDSCVRSGDDCQAVHQTLEQCGTIVGLQIITEAARRDSMDFTFSIQLQNRVRSATCIKLIL